MKIKFLSGPRTGQFDHAPNTQETQLLVKAGIIEIIPWKDYRERLAATAAEQTAGTVVPVTVQHVEWGFLPPGNSLFHVRAIVKRTGSETIWFRTPPSDCPDSILKQFLEEDVHEPTTEQLEQFRIREAEERNRKIAADRAANLALARYRRV